MQLDAALESQFGAPPDNSGLTPLDNWRNIADVFAREPGATNPRTGKPVRGYVSRRIVETSGPPKPLLERVLGRRTPEYGIGRREAQRYITQEGKQKRGYTVGPGDPRFERVRAAAEESRRIQQGREAQAQLGAEGYQDIGDRGLEVYICGEFQCSQDRRYRCMNVYIDGEDLGEFLTLWAAGDEAGAAAAFQDAFFESVPMGAAAQWLDVEEITIR